MLFQQNIIDEIINGNCKEILSRIPSNSVQLTITSPPYGNAIDYDMHASGSEGYYRGKTKQEIIDYLDEMVEVFNDRVYRMTKDGGYCCIVIGNEVVNGTLQPLP
ncbi:MAG TPA: hypothetical protein VFD60_09740, partial [Nitrososphaeraceae archaeon]|nr:hypothetical protein [Nitrososphaeraceae archaeon]